MEKLQVFMKERSEEIVKGLLVIILLLTLIVFGFIYKERNNQDDSSENEFFEELFVEQPPAETPVDQLTVTSGEPVDDQVIIDVKGAVEAPGVYQMEAASRVIDCIEEAGGFLIEAEQKSVNLAQRIEDQMVIYIPLEGEEISGFEQLLPDKPGSQSTTDNSKIDLNKATKEELKSLNSIGDVKAESIISYRETNGSFESIEDIKNVSGIGEATFEKLREAIQVTP